MKRRAERQDETRQRIVEAAIALHTTEGPSRTTVSAIAEKAGVQRHTVYSHFPDERTLGLACSGLYAERHPLPDPEPWRTIADPEQRLRRALTEWYAYYAERAEELLPIVRDMDTDPLARELMALRFRPRIERAREVLAEPFHARGTRRVRLLATIDVFMDLHTWRTLSRGTLPRGTGGVPAIDAAVRAICAQ